MNPVIDSIKNRRSVRKYTDAPVSKEALEVIIEAGLYAPSAHNNQPWHFSVVTQRDLIDAFNQAALKEMKDSPVEVFRKMAAKENYDIFYHAPVVVFISGEEKAMMPQTDCAAATQNMILAAESMGLGTCWIGLIRYALEGPEGEKLFKALNLPYGYSPYYALCIGHKQIPYQNPPARREGTVSWIE